MGKNPLFVCWNGEAFMDAIIGEATYTPKKTTPPPQPAKAQISFAIDGLVYTSTVTSASLETELTSEHVAQFNEELAKVKEDADLER